MRLIPAVFALFSCLAAGTAAAQAYPAHPIRWLVPYPAGGGADNVARVVTQRLSQKLGQAIVVDIRPGGNTIIGTPLLLLARRDLPVSDAPAIRDLLGGQIDLYFSDPATALPYLRTGKLKVLLVSTRERLPYLPDVPTVAESGYPGFDMYSWQGVLAPKGMPPQVRDTLAAAIRDTLQQPDVNRELRDRGFIPDPGTPEQFRAFFLRSQAELGEIVRKRNIRIQ